MDFPKSVPSAGLVDGKFIDEDSLTGTPGSLIPAAWGNSITLEVLNVIEGAGLTPDEDNNAQLLQAISSMLDVATPEATETVLGLVKRATQQQVDAGTDGAVVVSPKGLATAVQNQTLTAFTTAGVAPAFTLTPSPAVTAYATPLRFSVKFNAAAPTNGTLNVSGQGAKNLKQYDSTGNKIVAVIAANQIADVLYDGTDFIVLDPLPSGSAVPSGFVLPYAANVAPTGWLKANGAAVSRTTYASLFAAISITFGAGDGSTTFNLPDLRAEVIRGWDDGRGIDVARAFASLQLDAFQGHWHSMFYNASTTVGSGGNAYTEHTNSGNNQGPIVDAVRAPISDGTNGTPRTANETRARNVALLYCIKI
ncbi:phage tail protein [Pseudomonas sp. BF-R-01]|uniref:phage tail protein n=1 Tax=Pseudomonas sp. BF-R-01 TaxID=2832365 RepID=UPI001CBCB803|nr:phage tail protein [Pseudomonas sp. BF-R-01]